MKKSIIDVWRISWPLIIANSFWNIQITIDRMFLGEYSTETLAATTAVTGLFWAPMALVQQTAAYVTTFVAQYLGAKKEEFIGASLWQSIYVSLFGGIIFLVLIPLTPIIFGWVGHSENLQILEIGYFQALAWTALPTALVASCSGFFTGLGKSKVIILINGIGMVFNVCFDYLFIFGNFGFPELGIVGAGVSTVIANYGAVLFGFLLIFRGSLGKKYELGSRWKLNTKLFKNFLKYGLPSGLQWALEGLAFTFFLVYIGRMPNGDSSLAATSITVTIMMLALLPSIGVAQGVSALVGQNLGKGDPEAASKVTWAGFFISIAYISTLALSFVSVPTFYMGLFKSSKSGFLWEQVSQIVPTLLVFVAVFILFDAVNLIFSFALKGAGDTRFVSLVALLLPWPIMVVPTWYVSDRIDGVYLAWAATSCYIIIQALVFLVRFLGGRWKSMSVIEGT